MKRGHNQDENFVAQALQDLSKRFCQAFEPQETKENVYSELHEINRSLDYICDKTDVMVNTFIDIRDLIATYVMGTDNGDYLQERYDSIKRKHYMEDNYEARSTGP